MKKLHRNFVVALLMGAGVSFLSGCNENSSSNPQAQEATPTVSDHAAQEITNYIQEPQQKVRNANQAILDADQARRKAIDENL